MELDLHVSDRLMAIANLVPMGANLADIGTDHALLPTFLVLSGRISQAIASDIAEGPCESARRSIAQHGVEGTISVRLGPGLSTVHPGEVDTVVIAGMGGTTAVQILEASPNVVKRLRRVIVQPMNAADAVRAYLYEHGHWIDVERTVADDGRLYDVIAANIRTDVSTSVIPDPLYHPFLDSEAGMACALSFGPWLLTHPGAATILSVSVTVNRWKDILQQMAASQGGETATRRQVLAEKVGWANAWLVKARRGAEGSKGHESVES